MMLRQQQQQQQQPQQPPPLYDLVAFRQPPPPPPPPPPPLPLPSSSSLGKGLQEPSALKSEQQQLRRKINSRERKRMQDLNLAMDALREVILPYSAAHCQSSPGRKLSKIATLLLARNYILLLGSSLQELRRILAELSGGGAAAAAAAASGSLGPGAARLLLPLFATAASPGPVLLATSPGNVSHHHHHHHLPGHEPSSSKYLALALEDAAQPCGAGLCPCALCKVPHLVPSGLGLAALQAPFGK